MMNDPNQCCNSHVSLEKNSKKGELELWKQAELFETIDFIYVPELLQVLKSLECFTNIYYTEITMIHLLLTQKVAPVKFRTHLATIYCTGIWKRRNS